MNWFFGKKTRELHPLLSRFKELTNDEKVLNWFDRVANGHPPQLPIDIAFAVKEAMDLSFSITSMAAIPSTVLVYAARNDDFDVINQRLIDMSRALDEKALDRTSGMKQIIKWADKYDLPEFHPVDALFYKEGGIPRDIRKLQRLRFIWLEEGQDIEDIPDEVSQLPLLQGICIPKNRIRAIPTSLYLCSSLQRLDLEGNEITRIEDGIHRLRTVHAIDLSGNCLAFISPDIAKMPCLTKLDIRNQQGDTDIMRARDTPLSDASLKALHKLGERIDVKY